MLQSQQKPIIFNPEAEAEEEEKLVKVAFKPSLQAGAAGAAAMAEPEDPEKAAVSSTSTSSAIMQEAKLHDCAALPG